jgi:U3 small nucleolar RNA-associated protein 5
MPAVVRSRKAEGSLSEARPAKRSRKNDARDLKSALFSNGVPKQLKAETGKTKGNAANSHVVNDVDAVISKAEGHGKLASASYKRKQPVLETIVISSDEEDDEDDDEEEEEEEHDPKTNGVNGHSDDVSDDEDGPDNQPSTEPTFEEQLSALYPKADIVDVDEHFEPDASNPQPRLALVPVSGSSLTTVLAQALRTNDSHLLESCLVVSDLDSVRLTIMRLKGQMAVDLLLAIAERLYARPGRANNLMVWLQWTLVAHGGYLASQKDVTRALGSLYRVIKERAGALQPLLSLKGKLDMLQAQMELRRAANMENSRKEDEGMVVYVEGEEDEEAVGGALDDMTSDEEDDLEIEDADVEILADEDAHDDSDSSDSEDDLDSDSEASSRGFSDREGVDFSEGDDGEEEEATPPPRVKTRRSKP